MSNANPLFSAKFSQASGQKQGWLSGDTYQISYSFSPLVNDSSVALRSKLNGTCPADEKMRLVERRDHISDCEKLSATELRRLYPREASSHKNMLHRRNRENAIVHPQLYEFRSFLRILGPKPARRATVDRINNDDREYAPGKVRWADKRTQNSNKGDSNIFFDMSSRQSVTTSQLARRQGVTPAAIRKRLQRGWTDGEIVAGKTQRIGSALSPKQNTGGAASNLSACDKLTWAEREYISTAASYREQREEDGTEAFIPTYEFCRELRAECGLPYTEEDYLGYFRQLWPLHRPHLDYFNPTLPESQRQLISKIDPGYVQQVTSKQLAKSNLKNRL